MHSSRVNREPFLQSAKVVYILLLFHEDDPQKYEIIASSSTLFRRNTRFSEMLERDEIYLRDGTVATVVALTDDRHDLLKTQDRLFGEKIKHKRCY